MTRAFSLQGYGLLLGALRARGYRCRPFHNYQLDQAHLLLRHDVDLSLAAAVRMAELEQALGGRATYFVMIRSELYNPCSADGLAALRRIRDLGHDVGLHTDTTLYGDDGEALDEGVALEAKLLERLVGQPVTMISVHRPSRAVLGSGDTLGGRPHTYAPRYFEATGYCSDSRGRFGEHHPLDHPAVQQGRALQLLIHPIWWVADDEETAQDKLERFAAARVRHFHQTLARECSVYEAPAEGSTRVRLPAG